MERERLARIEEKLDGTLRWMKEFSESQGEKNGMFFEVRDKVNALEAASRGAWKVLAVLGTVSAGLGATLAFLVEHPPSLSFSQPFLSGTTETTRSERDKSEHCCSLAPASSTPSPKER